MSKAQDQDSARRARAQQVAEAIEGAAARLREIVAATDMHGQMVDAFRDKARSVADDVTRAHTR